MSGRQNRPKYETVILERYDTDAQIVIKRLDEMREHQAKCSRCRYVPVGQSEARPCVHMTRMAIWAAVAWQHVDRETDFKQESLFDPQELRGRVN